MNAKIKSVILTPFNLLYRINPVLEQKLLFRMKCGFKLDFNDPKTYNEKIQWIKMYFKHPLMTKLCDKYLARKYVEDHGYGNYLPKLYWNGFDANDIPWDELPNRFVAKVTHGSGGNIICLDKESLNRDEATKKLNALLKNKFIEAYGEWFYGVEKPRIIVEEFLDDGTGEIPADYKMFYFNNYKIDASGNSGGLLLPLSIRIAS